MTERFYPSFKAKGFYLLWGTMAVAYCAIWMQDTATGWMLTELNASPSTIALLQVTTSMPVFLLALPGGVIGDRLDRRTVLITVQLILAANASFIALMALNGQASVPVFLVVNAVAGCCLAFSSPVRHALTPLLVERPQFVGAVTLNSVGFNAARLIGPAVAGVIIALTSAAYTFASGAVLLTLAAMTLLIGLKVPAQDRSSAGTSPVRAALDALALAWRDPMLRRTLATLAVFSACAGTVYALLPLIMRDHLGAQEATYGMGMVSLGAGAIIGGTSLGWLRRWLTMTGIHAVAGLFVASGIAVIALTNVLEIGMIGFLVSGAGWVMTLSSLNAELQLHIDDGFRSRVTSLALMSNSLGLAGSSPLWGRLVELSDIATALLVSVGLVLVLTIARLLTGDFSGTSAGPLLKRGRP